MGFEFRAGFGVPGYTEAVDVEEAVTGSDFGFVGLFVRVGGAVGEEFGEIVLMDLFGEGMGLVWL